MSTNLHISLTRFTHESRVLKEIETLLNYQVFKKIIVIALHEGGLAEYERINNNIEVYRILLKTRKLPKNIFFQMLKYLELIYKIISISFHKKPVVVNCHSVMALPLGGILKLLFHTRLIYDTHELETETHGLKGFRRRIAKICEASLIPFADRIIVVSDSIKKWYEESYNRCDCYVIKNFPRRNLSTHVKSNILKEEFYVGEHEILFFYQGKFAFGRGIEALLEVFSRMKHDKHIVFMGYGQLQDRIMEYSEKYGNIHFHPAVPPEEVGFYARGADVGVNFTDNSCLSRYFALSNKLFVYLNNGIPVIVSDFPEQAAIVDTYFCGWKVDARDKVKEDSLFNLLSTFSKEEVDKKKKIVSELKDTFVWERQEEILVDAYFSLDLAER